MIVLNFEKWHDAHLEKYHYYRIYYKGWKWTPFVKRSKR